MVRDIITILGFSPNRVDEFRRFGCRSTSAVSALLVEHRNYIYETYLKLPIDF